MVFSPVIKVPEYGDVLVMFKAKLVPSLVTFGADELFGEAESQLNTLNLLSITQDTPAERILFLGKW